MPIKIDLVIVLQHKIHSNPCLDIFSVKGSSWLHFFLLLLLVSLAFLELHVKSTVASVLIKEAQGLL